MKGPLVPCFDQYHHLISIINLKVSHSTLFLFIMLYFYCVEDASFSGKQLNLLLSLNYAFWQYKGFL